MVWCGVRVCACVRVSACVHACVRAHSEWSTFVKALLQKIPVTSTLQACRDLSENFVWTVYICYCSLCSQQTCTIPSTLCVDCVYTVCYCSLCCQQTCTIPSTLCSVVTMRQLFHSKRRKTPEIREDDLQNRSLFVLGRATCCPFSLSVT